jgi:tetratricopeptide (TPR) repeat protein
MLVAVLAGTPAFAAIQPAIDPLYQPAGEAQARFLGKARDRMARKDYAEAIVQYDKVIALQPRFAGALAERAFAREAAGDLEGAMRDHDEVLRLSPDRSKAWSHAGWIRALRGIDLDQALTDSNKAVAIEPNIDAVDTRGFVHFRRGEYAAALTDYDAVLSAYPRAASTLYMRGVVQARLGADSAPDIAKALKIDKGVAGLWAARGVTP